MSERSLWRYRFGLWLIETGIQILPPGVAQRDLSTMLNAWKHRILTAASKGN